MIKFKIATKIKIAMVRNLFRNLKLLTLMNLRDIDDELSQAQQQSTMNEENLATLKNQISALQAVDVDFHGYGNIVIIARIGSQDIVKIIPVKQAMNMRDYIDLAKTMEARYGAEPEYWDAPNGIGKCMRDIWR